MINIKLARVYAKRKSPVKLRVLSDTFKVSSACKSLKRWTDEV